MNPSTLSRHPSLRTTVAVAAGWRCRLLPRHAALVVAGLAISLGAQAGALEGRAQVVDGDTLQIRDQRVRLWGVDAPDAQQICQLDGKPWSCGEAARRALSEYVAQRKVRCEVMSPQDERNDRRARCQVGQHDLNQWLVQEGWALDDEPRGDRTYAQTQTGAALAGRGLWQGQFVEPWQWRAPTAEVIGYPSHE